MLCDLQYPKQHIYIFLNRYVIIIIFKLNLYYINDIFNIISVFLYLYHMHLKYFHNFDNIILVTLHLFLCSRL